MPDNRVGVTLIMPTTEGQCDDDGTTCAQFKTTSEEEWITSGPLGSRDAVLVFRTSILDSIPYPQPHAANSSENISTEKGSGLSGDSALPETRRSKCSIRSIPRKPSCGRKVSFENGQMEAGDKNKTLIDSNKCSIVRIQKGLDVKMWNSVSSSENSISSECNETEESEKDTSSYMEEPQIERPSSNPTPSDVGKLLNDDDGDFSDVLRMPAAKLKLTYKFINTETKLLRRIFTCHGLTETDDDFNFSILWTGIHLKPDMLRNLTPYQRVNHFPRSYELTRKDRLYKNIVRMQHLRGMKHFDFVPQSFLLPLESKDLATAHHKYRGPWIVKPAASSRGRGIFIVNSPDQIPQDEQVLVSQYVSDPLCIDGHKCDLRVYVLVTSFDPLIIYLYEEGLVRLATVKYNISSDNLWNPCMHLCNYSINKYHTDYIKSSNVRDEDVGHKWTLSALLRHLKSQGCDTNLLMNNIEDLIIKSIFSCAQSVISACRMFVPSGNNCFELYGFDILIDDTLKPWLLEVNLSPSMGVDSPLDTKVKSCLITDCLTCVGIPAYTAGLRAHYDNRWTRFRSLSNTKRTNTGDQGNNGENKRVSNKNSGSKQLTLEEQRIVRSARLQYARRAGFVRIFPTEDSMSRYGAFLDQGTGIPLSTSVLQGQTFQSPPLQHNYNQMLFQNLFGGKKSDDDKDDNSFRNRLAQYERVLEAHTPSFFDSQQAQPKCEEEGKRLRKQIIKMLFDGSELTQLQSRQAFSLYLEAILRRLLIEPRECHEKIILKFLNRVGGAVKAPLHFRNQMTMGIACKARSAMVAKLLGDFLEQYNRDTEAYVDTFDHIAMIPTGLFVKFLSQAQEADLEAILGMNTSITGFMLYLYNPCGLAVPPTPPIPSGLHGFLKALPAMVQSGTAARDFNKCESYYRPPEKEKKSVAGGKRAHK